MEEQTHQADVRDLAKFGYKQELRRALGVYSSFAVAFSYISPSTGIFTLFILGIALAGPFFYWSWPIVVVGQLIIALNFAEVSAHFPVAGSVYQWTKYLSNRTYAWFTGWIYLFAGILTIAGVVATVPLVLLPLTMLTLGLSWFLASLGVFVRDIRNAVAIVVSPVLFFLSPVFYPVDQIPEPFRVLVGLNPLTQILEDGRRTLLWGEPPHWLSFAAVSIVSLAVMQLGYAWFMKTKRGFADVV